MKRVFVILIALSGLFAGIPIRAYAAPAIGIWPSYGGDFEIFNVEQGSGPSDTRKVWIQNKGTSDLTITAISSPNAPFSLVSLLELLEVCLVVPHLECGEFFSQLLLKPLYEGLHLIAMDALSAIKLQ